MVADEAAIPLWRHRSFLLLWSGQAVSAIGSQVSGIALPLLVLALTGSAAQAGLVGAMEFLPYLAFSLPAGALVDRWNRKVLMIVCDVGRSINLVSIPLALALGHLTMIQIYAVGLIEGTLFVLFDLAEVATLTQIAGRERLTAATAWNQAIWPVSALSGPPLGGFLFGVVGRGVPFLADAVSYLVSACSLILVRIPFQEEREEAAGPLRAQVIEALHWLWSHPVIRFVALVSAVGDFLFSGVDLVLIVVARQAHAPAVAIGLIFTLAAVGGLAGSIWAARMRQRFGFASILIGSSWIIAVLYLLFSFTSVPPLLGLIWAGISFLVAISNTARLSFQRAGVPDDLQGRVASVMNLAAYGSLPLGQAATGVALQMFGSQTTIIGITVCLGALALWTTLSPRVREGEVP